MLAAKTTSRGLLSSRHARPFSRQYRKILTKSAVCTLPTTAFRLFLSATLFLRRANNRAALRLRENKNDGLALH